MTDHEFPSNIHLSKGFDVRWRRGGSSRRPYRADRSQRLLDAIDERTLLRLYVLFGAADVKPRVPS